MTKNIEQHLKALYFKIFDFFFQNIHKNNNEMAHMQFKCNAMAHMHQNSNLNQDVFIK